MGHEAGYGEGCEAPRTSSRESGHRMGPAGCYGASPQGHSEDHPQRPPWPTLGPRTGPIQTSPSQGSWGGTQLASLSGPYLRPRKVNATNTHPVNLCLGLSQGTRCSSRTCSRRGRNRSGREGLRLRSLQCPGEVPCSWEEQEDTVLPVTTGGRGWQV